MNDGYPEIGIDDEPQPTVDTSVESFDQAVNIKFWVTDLHKEKVGIHKEDQNMAKDRAFDKSMEIIGNIKDEAKQEPEGVFAINRDEWPKKKDQFTGADLAKKRMVMKWFQKSTLAFMGSIEEIVSTSLTSMICTGDNNIAAFKIIIPKYQFVIDLRKEHFKGVNVATERYCFSFQNPKTSSWEVYVLHEETFKVGSNWKIKRGDGLEVGEIKDRVVKPGDPFDVHFYSADAYLNGILYRVVVLFSMVLKFKHHIYEKLGELLTLFENGTYAIDFSPEEEKLFYNPRVIHQL